MRGLIPAHAGKTSLRVLDPTQCLAHPRSRGENAAWAQIKAAVSGSSPLTRGKPVRRSWSEHLSGLIPAHAGKTPHHDPHADHRRAHPRSRGENPSTYIRPASAPGSSPLTRGKPLRRRRGTLTMGLIPAHAGKTTVPEATREGSPAHPRSRGENLSANCPPAEPAGSSPLTRGKQ